MKLSGFLGLLNRERCRVFSARGLPAKVPDRCTGCREGNGPLTETGLRCSAQRVWRATNIRRDTGG